MTVREMQRSANIRRALEASLKRLQADYIDPYQFHHVDRDTPWDEIFPGHQSARADYAW